MPVEWGQSWDLLAGNRLETRAAAGDGVSFALGNAAYGRGHTSRRPLLHPWAQGRLPFRPSVLGQNPVLLIRRGRPGNLSLFGRFAISLGGKTSMRTILLFRFGLFWLLRTVHGAGAFLFPCSPLFRRPVPKPPWDIPEAHPPRAAGSKPAQKRGRVLPFAHSSSFFSHTRRTNGRPPAPGGGLP